MVGWIKNLLRRLGRNRIDDVDEALLDAISELEEYFEGEHEPAAVHRVRVAYALRHGAVGRAGKPFDFVSAVASWDRTERFVEDAQRRLQVRRSARVNQPDQMSPETEARAKSGPTEVL